MFCNIPFLTVNKSHENTETNTECPLLTNVCICMYQSLILISLLSRVMVGFGLPSTVEKYCWFCGIA